MAEEEEEILLKKIECLFDRKTQNIYSYITMLFEKIETNRKFLERLSSLMEEIHLDYFFVNADSPPEIMYNRYPLLRSNITDCDFTVRTTNVLNSLNIETLLDLIKLRQRDLIKIRSCGKKTISEINLFLVKNNLLNVSKFYE